MRRFLFALYAVLCAAALCAQERQGLYIYRNNGNIDVFYTDQVDSIFYSNLDAEGNQQEKMVSQMVRRGRYLYKIPLAEIDSVSFTHPDPLRMRREGKLNPITGEAFRSLVWNYKENPDQLVFEGERPVVVDYWAPWCGYCMKMMPLMEQLAQEYKGKVDFYKVNTDDELELSDVMGMTSLPCLYFYPKKGEPLVRMGAMDLASMRKIIEEVLLITEDEDAEAVKPEVEMTVWKGDRDQEWTDRKVTATMKCLSQNATLVKYGLFLKADFVNSGLSERDMVQNYGEVLPEALLAEMNGSLGVTLSFPAKKGEDYVFVCLVKNEEGGVTVTSSAVRTDAEYEPLLDFQVQRGALEDLMEPGQKYVSIFMKGKAIVEGSYVCLTTEEYKALQMAGETKLSILERRGTALTADQLAQANGRGYNVAIGGLKPETDYTCLAMARDGQGKVSTTSVEVYTPFEGYGEHIAYPELGLVASRLDGSVSCSMNCSSGDAIYAALLMVPSAELSTLLATGKSLEEVMDSHPSVVVFADQQLEWINGQGISNVYADLQADTRYTWVADLRGRFGGRTVKRTEIKTLPEDSGAATLDVVLNASYVQGMLNVSASCTTGNATAATVVLMESQKLESLLASGVSLEELMERPAQDFIHHESLSAQQLEWLNQNGYIMGHSDFKKDTRYTWVIDVRGAKGERMVTRSEVLTPKK